MLLPAFDEYQVAYRDRDAMLAPEHQKRLGPGGGILAPCIVIRGRVIGTWRRERARKSVVIEIDAFESTNLRMRQAIAAAARRYGTFLGSETRITWGAGRR